MLTQLYIENIAVIERAAIDFQPGFNVLTGETGAGKSILIDSLHAVLGERTSRDLIRTGARSAFVSAAFCDVGKGTDEALRALGYTLEEDGTLLLPVSYTHLDVCKRQIQTGRKVRTILLMQGMQVRPFQQRTGWLWQKRFVMNQGMWLP